MKNPDRLLVLQRQLIVLSLTILLLAVLIYISYFFADILRILGISLLLSYLGIAFVDFLQKYLRDRRAAVLVVFVVLIAFLVVSALLVVPAVVVQITQLVQTTFDSLPNMLNHLTQMLMPLETKFRAYQIPIKVVDIMTNLIAGIPKPDPSAILFRVTDVAMGTATWLFYWISIAVVTFYFLLEGSALTESMVKLFPKRSHDFVRRLTRDADRSLQSFFRGQIILGIAFGIVMLAIYMACGVEYALLLAIFLGAMEIMPVIGPPLGFFPAVLSVAVHGCALPGNKLVQILILTAVFAVLQQAKDNVIAPRYIGNVIGLHPILIFVAIMVGARLDGTLGIIFALPAACVLNVVWLHIRDYLSEGDAAEIAAEAKVPPDLPVEAPYAFGSPEEAESPPVEQD
ncbi:MAG: AI-2E family transporter [Candidatus Obscuribacterales bacterium]|nr:AI-2E family transporter [Candidatus Obscuribacterales bacterium]